MRTEGSPKPNIDGGNISDSSVDSTKILNEKSLFDKLVRYSHEREFESGASTCSTSHFHDISPL
jgi:hypothetical protein